MKSFDVCLSVCLVSQPSVQSEREGKRGWISIYVKAFFFFQLKIENFLLGIIQKLCILGHCGVASVCHR